MEPFCKKTVYAFAVAIILSLVALAIAYRCDFSTTGLITTTLSTFAATFVLGIITDYSDSDTGGEPLIGHALIAPATLASSYGPGTKVKAGLVKLQGHFNVLKVKGDGHCMFRGIAYGIATDYAAGDANVKTAYLVGLNSLKAQYPALLRDIDRVIEILQNQEAPEATMSTKAPSDSLVSFLRKLACAYNVAHPSDAFRSNLAAGGESMSSYCRTMTHMNPDSAVYGGQPELVALSTVLGLKISVVDALVQDAAEIYTTDLTPPQALNPGMNRPSVTLLYLPGHYDVLIPV
jgi:hypothetical protein